MKGVVGIVSTVVLLIASPNCLAPSTTSRMQRAVLSLRSEIKVYLLLELSPCFDLGNCSHWRKLQALCFDG